MSKKEPDEIRRAVREAYSKVVGGEAKSCDCGSGGACCGPQPIQLSIEASEQLGYSAEEMSSVPEGSNLGLGCGNPQAIANLKKGETVVDLGSGAGFDCFLAAKQVGESGKVIGIDMTPDMVSKARENAAKGGYSNISFRLGEIEYQPVADNTVDVIISNCVINLSPDKDAVFRDAFRILKPGGRLAISDIVATADLPEEILNDTDLLCGCVSGAARIGDLEEMLADAGFEQIRIRPKDESREFIRQWAEGRKVEDYIVSATIEAIKPMTA